MTDTAERYERSKTLPTDRKTATGVAWEQGYEAGWADAALRWLTQPAHNDTNAIRLLNRLIDHLNRITVDGITVTGRYTTILADLAETIRRADDDTTTWSQSD